MSTNAYDFAGFLLSSQPTRRSGGRFSRIFSSLRRKAEWFAWIVVELLGTRLGWCWPQLQGGYSLMDLINRGYFLFFSTSLPFRSRGAHFHFLSRPRCSAL